MILGLDVGYHSTKWSTGKRSGQFPSVVGTPDVGPFSLNGQDDMIFTKPHHVSVGAGAVIQSRHIMRREDRGWIESEPYASLVAAALTEATTAAHCNLVLVSGLPVSFFALDKQALAAQLTGTHSIQRMGRNRQSLTVDRATIVPQGVGCLLSEALDDRGNIERRDLATGHVGIIDVGSHTTGLLSVSKLAAVGRETASVAAGTWDVARAVGRWVSDNCPGLDVRDHDLMDAIERREILYNGPPVDLGAVIDGAADSLADQVIAQASQLWNGAAHLGTILIAGGGSHLVGERIMSHFSHAQLVDGDPQFSNAAGYAKFAQRLART